MLPVRNQIGGVGNLLFKEAYLLAQVFEGELPDVYIQQYSRWKKWLPEIREHFMSGITPSSINKVSLHIRRGDYLKAKSVYIDLTETDYYQKAVALFPNDEFLVFCKDNQDTVQDKKDREWCINFLNTFIPGRFTMNSSYMEEHEDLNMMASCKAHISANSTFSWFASFLGGGETIMPKEWFTKEALNAGVQKVEMLPAWKLI